MSLNRALILLLGTDRSPDRHTLPPPMYVYIYIHTYIHTHVYIYTHTHTNICMYMCKTAKAAAALASRHNSIASNRKKMVPVAVPRGNKFVE